MESLFARMKALNRSQRNSSPSFIDTMVEMKGRLEFVGLMHINSHFRGDIVSSGTLMVGPQADIHGAIQVGCLRVLGHVEGDIDVSGEVVLYSTALLQGFLRTSTLVVESGAVVQCEVFMKNSAEGVVSGDGETIPMIHLSENVEQRHQRAEADVA